MTRSRSPPADRPRRRRNRQDARDRDPLQVADRAGLRSGADVPRGAERGARGGLARAARDRAGVRLRGAPRPDPAQLAALVLRGAGAGVGSPGDRAERRRPAGDAGRADRRALARAPRLRRSAQRAAGGASCAGSTGSRPSSSVPRSTCAGRSRWRPTRRSRRSSASSPRSTALTSECSPTAGARDAGDLIVDAISLARKQPELARRFDHVLVDDAQELDLAPARLCSRSQSPG